MRLVSLAFPECHLCGLWGALRRHLKLENRMAAHGVGYTLAGLARLVTTYR